VLADLTVREYDAPHHLGEDHLLAEVVVLRDGSGEPEMINGFAPRCLGPLDQFPGRISVQPEVAAECRLDVVTLGRAELVIGMREIQQECAGSELDVIGLRTSRYGFGASLRAPDPTSDETLDRVQHLRETSYALNRAAFTVLLSCYWWFNQTATAAAVPACSQVS
jgi:hypothetical protein